jgi:hypothetical protein
MESLTLRREEVLTRRDIPKIEAKKVAEATTLIGFYGK